MFYSAKKRNYEGLEAPRLRKQFLAKRETVRTPWLAMTF